MGRVDCTVSRTGVRRVARGLVFVESCAAVGAVLPLVPIRHGRHAGAQVSRVRANARVGCGTEPRGGGKVRMVVGATVLTMTLPLAVGVFYAKMVGVSGAPTVLLALGLTVLDSPDARLLAEIGTRVDAALPASDGLDWASRRLVRRYVERTLLHSSPFPSSDLKRWQNPVGNYWPDRYLDCMDLAVRLDSPSGRPARTILLGLQPIRTRGTPFSRGWTRGVGGRTLPPPFRYNFIGILGAERASIALNGRTTSIRTSASSLSRYSWSTAA